MVGRSITRTNQLAGLKINQIGFLARWYSQVYPRFSKKGFRKPVIHRGTNHSFNGLSLDAVIFLGKGIDRISTCSPMRIETDVLAVGKNQLDFEIVWRLVLSMGRKFYGWGGRPVRNFHREDGLNSFFVFFVSIRFLRFLRLRLRFESF